METLYFLFPILAVVALITFAITRINSRSYIHKRVEARVQASTQDAEPNRPLSAHERMEQRYVDWFTGDHKARARERARNEDPKECLVGQAVMAGGMAYTPSETAPVANF